MIESAIHPSARRTIRVLFVDDDADARFAYEALAIDEGMSPLLASSGVDAMALATLVRPDVIVLDVGLQSDFDGIEVAIRLRASPATRAIPVIFLTGTATARQLTAMRAIACEGYLTKPCSADALLGLVTTLAMRRQAAVAAEQGDAHPAVD